MNTLIIFSANYLFIVSIIIFLGYLIHAWKNHRKTGVALVKLSLLSFPSILIVAKICSYFFNDPRPFVAEHINPLIPHIADNGFPSDHALLTMAIASIIFAYNKKLGIILFSIASIIGIARVLANIHHPIDIVGSAIIAIVVTVIIILIENKTIYLRSKVK